MCVVCGVWCGGAWRGVLWCGVCCRVVASLDFLTSIWLRPLEKKTVVIEPLENQQDLLKKQKQLILMEADSALFEVG